MPAYHNLKCLSWVATIMSFNRGTKRSCEFGGFCSCEFGGFCSSARTGNEAPTSKTAVAKCLVLIIAHSPGLPPKRLGHPNRHGRACPPACHCHPRCHAPKIAFDDKPRSPPTLRSHLPPGGLRWIAKREIDGSDAADRDDHWFIVASDHPIVMRRSGDAANETASGDRHA
jgi:hypothetical protein